MENITIKGLDIPAIYHPCNRGNYGGTRPLSAIKYIVIHYTANLWDSAKSNLNYFANNVVKASANYFVDSKTIGVCVPDECYAWHCGGGLQGVGSHKWFNICNNWNSIGIEICHDKKTGDYYPDEDTYRNVVQLTAYLMKKYNVPIENVIRHWDVTSKKCLPIDKTELLTKSGWVNLGDIKIGDVVAQYDTENDKIVFGDVKSIVEPHVAETWEIRKLEATPDHRMWVKPNCTNSHHYRETELQDCVEGNKQYIIKTSSQYDGCGLPLTDDELKLIVWTQGDGHYIKNKNGDIIGLEFHLKKLRKIDRIEDILNNLGIEYNVSHCKNGSVHIRKYGKEIVDWCEQWLNNKVFSYKLLEMSQRQFEVFWDELIFVDGSVENNSYFSAIEENLNVVQALCAIHNKRSNKCYAGICENVIVSPSNYSIGGRKKNITKRETMVSCVTVDTGYILIRQNGRTFIVGNCPAYWIGDDNADWLKFKEAVEEEVAVRYKTINEVPDSIRKEVKEVIDAGCLKGNGEKGIDMTYNELRVLVICLRIVKFFTGKK